jgi:Domain of unknown function (DUF5979)
MRRGGRALLAVMALATGPMAFVLTASPASAGFTPKLTVTKVVEGTAPPGAEWVVDIDCGSTQVAPQQMTFTGPGSQSATVGGAGTCTVVESGTSGATVTYACEVNVNPDHATCTSNNEVTYTFTATDFPEATVTVTNTYAPPAPPAPPAPTPPEAPAAAEPVAAAAQFTG